MKLRNVTASPVYLAIYQPVLGGHDASNAYLPAGVDVDLQQDGNASPYAIFNSSAEIKSLIKSGRAVFVVNGQPLSQLASQESLAYIFTTLLNPQTQESILMEGLAAGHLYVKSAQVG